MAKYILDSAGAHLEGRSCGPVLFEAGLHTVAHGRRHATASTTTEHRESTSPHAVCRHGNAAKWDVHIHNTGTARAPAATTTQRTVDNITVHVTSITTPPPRNRDEGGGEHTSGTSGESACVCTTAMEGEGSLQPAKSHRPQAPATAPRRPQRHDKCDKTMQLQTTQ